MDDFGTGYSSLSNLRLFPFDKHQDRRLLHRGRRFERRRRRPSCARCSGSARGLGMPVIAEGRRDGRGARLPRRREVPRRAGLLHRPTGPDQRLRAADPRRAATVAGRSLTGADPLAAERDLLPIRTCSGLADRTCPKREARRPARAGGEAPRMNDETGHRPGEVAIPLPEDLRRRALLHRPRPHALGDARRVPEERAEDRRGLHARRRCALCRGPPERRGREPPHRALLDGRGRPGPGAAAPPPRRGQPGHLLPALAGAPQPIALSVVELLDRDGATLRVRGLDCRDGTPLLDIKPYFATTDSRPGATVERAGTTPR